MKLGVVSSIFKNYDFDKMIDVVASLGLTCIEASAWPKIKTSRRYAGVQHIDPEKVIKDSKYRKHIIEYSKMKNVEIASLGYHANILDGNIKNRNNNITHLKKCIVAAYHLNVKMVTCFIGRDQNKNIEENIEIVKKVWPSILNVAKKYDIRLAIENCPMLFTKNEWPGGQNIMSNPELWNQIFKMLDSEYLGLNYDPSHFVWQMLDYIKPIKEFKNKIWQLHIKDVKLHKEKLERCSILSYPLNFMTPKLPGLGDIDWDLFIKEIKKIKYDSYAILEIEDKDFENNDKQIITAIKKSKKFILDKGLLKG